MKLIVPVAMILFSYTKMNHFPTTILSVNVLNSVNVKKTNYKYCNVI